MKSLVIYASVYGNTEKVARAIADTLAAKGEVNLINIKDARLDILKGVDLLLVGSPTQAFNPLPPLKNWLKNLPKASLAGLRVAAFDTRLDIVKVNNKLLTFLVGIFGYAAGSITKALVKKGGRLAAEPVGFIVEGSEGPLRTGELERAGGWAKKLKN